MIKERSGLWLRFRCGHLRRLRAGQDVHYWLERAKRIDCAECQSMSPVVEFYAADEPSAPPRGEAWEGPA